MASGKSYGVVYFADKGLELGPVPQLRSELLMFKGLAYTLNGNPDSAVHYIIPNMYSVDMTARMKSYRAMFEMYDSLGNIPQAYEFLKKYTMTLDSLIKDRRDDFWEKMHGIHGYNIQKNRENKAEMQAA